MSKLILPLAAVLLIIGAASWRRASWDVAISIAPGRGFVVELAAAVLFLVVVGVWFVLSRRDHWKDSRQ